MEAIESGWITIDVNGKAYAFDNEPTEACAGIWLSTEDNPKRRAPQFDTSYAAQHPSWAENGKMDKFPVDDGADEGSDDNAI